jgi:hypothetical protein
VNVADFLQTDDLYQLATPLELPQLPEFDELHAWPCPHPQLASAPAAATPCPAPSPTTGDTSPPAPTLLQPLGERIDKPTEPSAAGTLPHALDASQPPDETDRILRVLEPPSVSSPSSADPPAPQLSIPPAADTSRRTGAAVRSSS